MNEYFLSNAQNHMEEMHSNSHIPDNLYSPNSTKPQEPAERILNQKKLIELVYSMENA